MLSAGNVDAIDIDKSSGRGGVRKLTLKDVAESSHLKGEQEAIMTNSVRSIVQGSLRRILCLLTIVGLLALLPALSAQAQTLTVLHGFSGGTDGAYPYRAPTVDAAGNFYGASGAGGIGNYGTVYKVTHTVNGWQFSTLYRFLGYNDGANPVASPVFGPDGALYGTTTTGGGGCRSQGGCGTVYRLSPPASACKTALCEWTETVIYRAATDNGEEIEGGLIFDRAGNIYGTVALGGANEGGYVFELMRNGSGWTSQVLYSFNALQGECGQPLAGLVFDSAGNLYGTANTGCDSSGGIFELTPSSQGWSETIVRSFNDLTDGSGSYAPLVPDGHGGFYGTTFDLGPNGGGTVFQLTPSGQGWAFSIIWAFYAFDDNGQVLLDPVMLDAAGNLYGTTFECFGTYGTIFELSPTSNGWTETVLYRFLDGDDGGFPESSVIKDAQGNLYGTTAAGGVNSNGVIWKLTP